MRLVYEGNPKHKEPWQPGRKGSLCPHDIGIDRAQILLQSSIVDGKKRYSVEGGRAFCAQQHNAAKNRWHGYPVGWAEVPATVRRRLVKIHGVSKGDLSRFWENVE